MPLTFKMKEAEPKPTLGLKQIKVKSFSSDKWYLLTPSKKKCSCGKAVATGKCKHLAEFGVHVAYPFKPTTHPTFSQALSGLVKSLRIRNVEEAVYWLVYMHNFKGDKSTSDYRTRVARRLLIGSAEDGHSIAVMEKVAENHGNINKVGSDFVRIVAEAVRICQVPNWWHPSTGGPDYIKSGMLGFRAVQGMQFTDNETDKAIVLNQLEEAFDQQDKVKALTYVMALEQIGWGSTKQAAWLQHMATERKHELAGRLTEVHLKCKSPLSGDSNFICQAAWMLAGGVSPVADSEEPVYTQNVMGLIEQANEAWKTPHKIPGWCCDGVHCAGDDPRFMGMWPYMYAACKQFEKYGRLDPSDEWLPEFFSLEGLTYEKLY